MKTSNNLSISHFPKTKFQEDPVSLSYGLSHLYTKKIPWSNFFFKTEKSTKSPNPPPNPPTHTFGREYYKIKSTATGFEIKI